MFESLPWSRYRPISTNTARQSPNASTDDALRLTFVHLRHRAMTRLQQGGWQGTTKQYGYCAGIQLGQLVAYMYSIVQKDDRQACRVSLQCA